MDDYAKHSGWMPSHLARRGERPAEKVRPGISPWPLKSARWRNMLREKWCARLRGLSHKASLDQRGIEVGDDVIRHESKQRGGKPVTPNSFFRVRIARIFTAHPAI